MVFIDFLRALAACLITNAHYTGIYPTDLIANGGLLGDVIFFAVSGYCLYHVRGSFLQWYGKRLRRCYLPVLVITVVYLLLGAYTLEDRPLFWWLVYPTYYHFVASIVVLYIPFYFIMKQDALKKRLPLVMLVLAAVCLTVYVFFYDKTYYHIDTVREPFIRFLFMECMLLGAWFRQEDARFRGRFSPRQAAAAVVLLAAYFASKLFFSRNAQWAAGQILNQAVLFALLYAVMRLFTGLDTRLEELPRGLRRIASFLAGITLEIYAVQYVLIDVVRDWALPFPVNWVCLTGVILAAAWVLHLICGTVKMKK